MRISGTEPSSVILNQTKKFKIWEVMPKSAAWNSIVGATVTVHRFFCILHSTKMYTPFLSDLIYNMDYMRISGTEPSSVILNQTKKFKIWEVMPKSAKTR